jgi:nucleoside-diphosphate kinase
VTAERTLILVKPDGVRRGLVGEVVGRLERKGLTLVALELRTLDRATAEKHYAEHVERPFFGELVEFIGHPRGRNFLPGSGLAPAGFHHPLVQ